MPAFAIAPPVVLVAIGSATGAVLRYLVGIWSTANIGPDLPFGTWSVNIAGSFAMGLLAGWLAREGGNGSVGGNDLRLILGVGMLGGFTTFSAFSLEVFTMINRNEIGLAAAYAVSSVTGAVLALMAGIWLVRA